MILCRGARSTDSAFQEQYRRAVKEAIPVVVFVTVHQCLITILLAYHVYGVIREDSSLIFGEIYNLYPTTAISIPLFLLRQSQLRQKMNTCNCKAILFKALHQSPKEELHTEQDPLLAKASKNSLYNYYTLIECTH